jgi:uncharacterized protein (TIGR03435 family)
MMVVDRTSLTGTFDFDLRWSPELPAISTGAPDAASLPEGASIFTAVQEQFGLKLELRREPRDVLVIDHVEMPTPN